MYTRVPQRKPQNNPSQAQKIPDPPVSLPKNYSGNAFTSDGHKRELQVNEQPQIPSSNQINEQNERKRPYISPISPPSIPIPSTSPLGYSDYPAGEYIRQEIKHDNPSTKAPEEEAQREESFSEYPLPLPVEDTRDTSKPYGGSLFSSILPGGIFKNNFPFGHGLGNEELLLLGIMLSIYMSGEADGELMMLLCLLLFAG